MVDTPQQNKNSQQKTVKDTERKNAEIEWNHERRKLIFAQNENDSVVTNTSNGSSFVKETNIVKKPLELTMDDLLMETEYMRKLSAKIDEMNQPTFDLNEMERMNNKIGKDQQARVKQTEQMNDELENYAEQRGHHLDTEPRKKIRMKALRAGKNIASRLNQISPAKWINDLEHDQELADRLELLNAENNDDMERKILKQEATEACLQTIQNHLMEFIDQHTNGSYEDWIEELHPENVQYSTSLAEGKTVDHRFYVEDSDHRKLWNEHLGDGAGDREFVAVGKSICAVGDLHSFQLTQNLHQTLG